MRIFAIDWSGARSGAHHSIYLAEVADGRLTRLEKGRSRDGVVAHLIEEAKRDPAMIVGLDFAFSFPAWFVEGLGVADAKELWQRVASDGETWLHGCEEPFWGRPGRRKPDLRSHFRSTELAAQEVAHAQPKSVFQIGGAGAVGTGSIRGMPALAELSDAGFSVWPFDPARTPLVIEIYPRLLTGAVTKSDAVARAAYLEREFPEMAAEHREIAASSEDALDAAVSALVMARHAEEILALRPSADRVEALEGRIWWPETEVPMPALELSPGEEPCPFCDVSTKEHVLENRAAVAIRDAHPIADGHTLILPCRHVASVFDLPTSELRELWELVARVRRELERDLAPDGFTVGVNDGPAAGQTIAHAHVHVIPRREGDAPDPRGGIRWVVPEKAAYWES